MYKSVRKPNSNNSITPAYLLIRQQIMSQAAREPDAMQKCPSVRELARMHEVSLPTAAKAVRQLTTEGLLTARHGVGTFIVPRIHRAAPAQGCIGLILSGGTQVHIDRVYMQIIAGIYDNLTQTKFLAQLIHSGNRDQVLVREIRLARLDGVIWINPAQNSISSLKMLESAGIKVVSIDMREKDSAKCSLSADLYDEGYRMADYLLNHGYDKIVRSGTKSEEDAGRQLVTNGFSAAYKKQGIKPDYRLWLERKNFPARLDTLIDLKIPFTAVAVGSPFFESVLSVLDRKKLRVPRDVAILTEDDYFTMNLQNPTPTRVARPLRRLGELAAKKMIDWLNSGKTPQSESLGWEVIEGETV